MLCYGDRTYCASKGCKDRCGRKPPEDLDEQVLRWWGKPGGPVAFSEFCGDDGELLPDGHGLVPTRERTEEIMTVKTMEAHEGK